MQCLQSPEEGTGDPAASVTGDCEQEIVLGIELGSSSRAVCALDH